MIEQDIMTGTRFVGTIMLIAIAVLLAMVNRGRIQSAVYNRSRWFIVCGNILLAIHMIIQFLGHYRETSISTCWAINMVFFVFVIPLYYLASVNILCAGHNLCRRYTRIAIFLVICYSLFGIGYATDCLINDQQPWMTTTFIVASLLFCMNIEMTMDIVKDLKKAYSSLNNVEENDRHESLRYFARSIRAVLFLLLAVPWWCMISSLSIISIITLCTFASLLWYDLEFYFYGRRMDQVVELNDEIFEAAVISEEYHNENTQSQMASVASAEIVTSSSHTIPTAQIEQWVSAKYFTDPNITIGEALKQMDISLSDLNRYLRQNGDTGTFRKWLSYLRIEEAKRLITIHSEYKLDTIAEMVGMSNGSSLSRTFKAQEGMTPTQWILKNND